MINLKRDLDETESNMLEIDYREIQAKKGHGQHQSEKKLESGKFIMVKGNKKYIDTTAKDDFIENRRTQKNTIKFINDLSTKKDKVNDPNERKDKHIRRKGKNRRDCSQNYKYISKKEIKKFTNKKDLRFDVMDINQKDIKFVPDELENDLDYLNYRNKLKKAKETGYMPEIYNDPITSYINYENGRRIWRSKSSSRVDKLNGIGSKRSKSPVRAVSRKRRLSHISRDEVDIKPYNPVSRDLQYNIYI